MVCNQEKTGRGFKRESDFPSETKEREFHVSKLECEFWRTGWCGIHEDRRQFLRDSKTDAWTRQHGCSQGMAFAFQSRRNGFKEFLLAEFRMARR